MWRRIRVVFLQFFKAMLWQRLRSGLLANTSETSISAGLNLVRVAFDLQE